MPADVEERARRQFGASIPTKGDLPEDALLALAASEAPEALLITSRVRMDARTIAKLPESVRVIATFSVGYDHIDVHAAHERGIVVTNTPDVLTDATADLTLLLLLAASRRASEYHGIISAGWGRRLGSTEYLGVQLTGKTLGIIGLGRIGQAVARRARAFGMKIAYHNRTRLTAADEGTAHYHADIEDLLKVSDVVSLHAPGEAGAPPLLDRERIAMLKPGVILINTARGSLVDEEALIEALEEGRLHSAGLDVFANEPRLAPRMLALKNVFLTPHIASATQETRSAMGHRALDNIAARLAGELPADTVP